MSKVVVVAAPGALGDHLEERLGAAASACLRLAPGDDGLAILAADVTTLISVAPASVGLGGVPDLDEAARVFEAAAGAGVGHLILISSAAIHAPSAHHAGHVSEARLSSRHVHPIATAWLDLEQLAERSAEDSDTDLAILRPAAVVVRGGGDFINRLLAGKIVFPLPGFDPSLQLLSADDLAAAVVRVMEKGATGVYHVAPPEVMPLRKALRAAGCWRLAVPYPLQWLARKMLAPAGAAAPIEQLDYVCHSWTVSAEKIHRELDFEPRRSSVGAVRELKGDSRATRASPLQGTATDEVYDHFGMDKDYAALLGRTVFKVLHDYWWRVEWKGLENVPRGRAVLAGVHRGHQPWDGVMTFHLLIRELGRYPRFLIHPTLVKFPFLAPYMIKCGGVHACQENADWVLEREGLLAIFPEGIRGAFTMYRDAYKLGRFGRDVYVKIALRHQAPIIPYVTVGSAEIFPILGRIDWPWWKRFSEWPFFPITPTMGTVPLPSKWHTWFLEPVPVDAYPPEAADDRATVRAISAQVRARMEEAIAKMLERRKSIWWGSVFDGEKSGVITEEAA